MLISSVGVVLVALSWYLALFIRNSKSIVIVCIAAVQSIAFFVSLLQYIFVEWDLGWANFNVIGFVYWAWFAIRIWRNRKPPKQRK